MMGVEGFSNFTLNFIYFINFLTPNVPCSNPNRHSNGSWVKSFYWPMHSRTLKEFLSLNPNNKTKGFGLDSRKCAFWNTYLPQLLGEKLFLY